MLKRKWKPRRGARRVSSVLQAGMDVQPLDEPAGPGVPDLRAISESRICAAMQFPNPCRAKVGWIEHFTITRSA